MEPSSRIYTEANHFGGSNVNVEVNFEGTNVIDDFKVALMVLEMPPFERNAQLLVNLSTY